MVKKYFMEKQYGFYVTLASILFSILAAIIYANMYHSYVNFMSWAAFSLFLVGAVLSIAALALKRYAFANLLLYSGNLLGALFYIRHIYSYVQVVLFGVDIASFSSNFILSTVFISIAFVFSLVALFLPQTKEKNETENMKAEKENA